MWCCIKSVPYRIAGFFWVGKFSRIIHENSGSEDGEAEIRLIHHPFIALSATVAWYLLIRLSSPACKSLWTLSLHVAQIVATWGVLYVNWTRTGDGMQVHHHFSDEALSSFQPTNGAYLFVVWYAYKCLLQSLYGREASLEYAQLVLYKSQDFRSYKIFLVSKNHISWRCA